jgi:thiamine biosynthesis lipoprotein
MEFKLVFYSPDQPAAKRAADAAFARIHELNSILSDYDPASELSRLSRSAGGGQPVSVSPELMTVLSAAQALAARTDGAFDVTAGPVIQLWRRARRQREHPSQERLTEARRLVGYQLLDLDLAGQRVRLAREGMRLDLGGIAAGYAADEALRILRAQGIHRAMIDASGDVVVGDPPPSKCGWRIGLVPPAASEPPIYVSISNCAIATSGDTEQFVELDGKRYSHIVDPRTGLGLTNRLSVTVVAPNGMQADSLATAVSVLGPQQGLALVADTPGVECRIFQITSAGPSTFQSPGFPSVAP